MKTRFTRNTDVLIVGSGIAGMLLALELTEQTNLNVTIATKQSLVDSNTAWAQGGLAAVTRGNIVDSPALHLGDTTASGAGLTDHAVAFDIIKEGEKLVRILSHYGTEFDQKDDGAFEMALEGGHSRARVLHNKDATGKAIATSLADELWRKHVNDGRLSISTNAFALNLLVADGRVNGALFDIDGQRVEIYARYVVLSTGGLGQVFARTTNPPGATGDGIALAFRAGARLIDMEFVQFHPTALCIDGAPPFLISEAVRGAGAKLLDQRGKQFALRFHKDGELATRDVVARAIHTVMHEQNAPNVFLDLRHLGAAVIGHRFPTIVANCRQYGIDPVSEPIPVCPAAHYFMGGIWTDNKGLTTVDGLYAIGECASTGLHGANRLASNSLLEAGVMGLRVAEHIASIANKSHAVRAIALPAPPAPFAVPKDIQSIKQSMYRLAGLVRNEQGLQELLDLLDGQCQEKDEDEITRQEASSANMLLLSKLIALAALRRRESRGSHFRTDFRAVDDANFHKRQFVSNRGWGWLSADANRLQPGYQAVLTA
jgi:L-aspartate oxidase